MNTKTVLERVDMVGQVKKMRKKKSLPEHDQEYDKIAGAIVKAAQEAGKHYGDAGLVSYLEAQAIATPSPFLTLLGKVLTRDDFRQEHKITRIEIVAPQLAKDN